MTIWEVGEEGPIKENEKSGKVRDKSDVKKEKKFRKGVGIHSGEKILDNKLPKITT